MRTMKVAWVAGPLGKDGIQIEDGERCAHTNTRRTYGEYQQPRSPLLIGGQEELAEGGRNGSSEAGHGQIAQALSGVVMVETLSH